MGIPIDVLATRENFDDAAYLAANPDVADAWRKRLIKSPRHHFEAYGQREGRRLRVAHAIEQLRADKLRRVEPLLKLDMPHVRRGAKYDFLTEELRRETGIVETTAFSSHDYDADALQLIAEFSDGLILDCGAGQKPTYHPNVVNYEIVDYESTDVLGVAESLPFKDRSFDAVISIAVLEHVRDPFTCAAEIARVLKPGGKLLCCVPLLEPLHGYPHHYYNMTGQGLRALFERHLQVDSQFVRDSTLPIWSLTWIVQKWAEGLSGRTREQFLALPLRDLLAEPTRFLDRPWVRELSNEKNFELAAATMLVAHKPDNRTTEPADRDGTDVDHARGPLGTLISVASSR
jgi:SAM-dependent methyltransferase